LVICVENACQRNGLLINTRKIKIMIPGDVQSKVYVNNMMIEQAKNYPQQCYLIPGVEECTPEIKARIA
jgi:hypothetical protein